MGIVIADNDKDDALVRRVAGGDEEAFTLLYRRHHPAIFRFAVRMTGNVWAAEEIVQDTFMTLMLHPRRFDASRGTLGGYLYGIARARVMKHLERLPRDGAWRSKPEDGTAAEMVEHHGSTPAVLAERREQSELVRAAILELPAEFREAVTLCELEEMKYEEAAQLVGCPIGTIRSRLHRGRVLLLEKLESLRSAPRRAGVPR